MKKYNHKAVIKDYINFEDLLKKWQYREYKPRLGSLGKALLKASNCQRSNNMLKKYWDNYFRELRQHKKEKQKEHVQQQNG